MECSEGVISSELISCMHMHMHMHLHIEYALRDIASIVVSGLGKINNTIAGLLPIVYRDTRVLSRALAALKSLQLGSHVCISV